VILYDVKGLIQKFVLINLLLGRLALSHLRLLGSLSVTSTNHRDYGGSILTRLHTGHLSI
jgi:hypothetical protein